MEKYSVLMSLYIKENPEYLRCAVSSMLDQTISPDEIVIVKDGPITEELQGVLDTFVAENPELFNIVGYEQNQGLGYALNFGLEKCRNELVARMDTDDVAVSSRIEEQLKMFEESPWLDIVGGDIAEFIGSVENIVAYRNLPTDNDGIRKYSERRCPFNHMTVMYKKSAVQAAGGYLDLFWNEDYYLWVRMLANNANSANTGTVLVYARTGADMYKRRGGLKYFKSEAKLQKYMLDNKLIGFSTYALNVAKRFIVQVLLPNTIRGWVFKNFARKRA